MSDGAIISLAIIIMGGIVCVAGLVFIYMVGKSDD